MDKYKICKSKDCGKKKLLSEFYKSPRNKDGYKNYCKECLIKKSSEWNKKNPKKVLKKKKNWKRKTPEKILNYNKNWRKRNHEKVLEYARKRRKEYPGVHPDDEKESLRIIDEFITKYGKDDNRTIEMIRYLKDTKLVDQRRKL